PHPKDDILYALLLEVARGDLPMVDQLCMAATRLAYYQPGTTPLRMFVFDNVPSPSGKAGWLALAKHIAGPEIQATKATFDSLNTRVREEIKGIISKIEHAKVLGNFLKAREKKAVRWRFMQFPISVVSNPPA